MIPTSIDCIHLSFTWVNLVVPLRNILSELLQKKVDASDT